MKIKPDDPPNIVIHDRLFTTAWITVAMIILVFGAFIVTLVITSKAEEPAFKFDADVPIAFESMPMDQAAVIFSFDDGQFDIEYENCEPTEAARLLLGQLASMVDEEVARRNSTIVPAEAILPNAYMAEQQMKSEDCCSRAIVMERGIRTAYRSLKNGDPERATKALKDAAYVAGIDLGSSAD